MAKKPKKAVGIYMYLLKGEHLGCHYFIQRFYENIFQFIIFKDGEWYQGFNDIKNDKEWSKKQIESAAKLTAAHAIATIETIIHKDNPDELLKKRAEGAEVARILEQANRLPARS